VCFLIATDETLLRFDVIHRRIDDIIALGMTIAQTTTIFTDIRNSSIIIRIRGEGRIGRGREVI